MTKKQAKQIQIIQSFKSTFSVMIITLLSISAIVYLIWQRNSVDTVMKDIDKLNRQREQIKVEINRLNRRVASLSHVNRIRKIAAQKFNLQEAKEKPILLLLDQEKYDSDLKKLSDRVREKENQFQVKQVVAKAGL